MKYRKSIINMTVLITLFIFYTLKFLVPPFYALTDKYAGLFVFFCEGILFLNNYDFISAIKEKNKEFFLIVFLLILIGVNLILVNSGYGAFFTAANFVFAFFLSDKIIMSRKQVVALSSIYMIMLLIWLIYRYPQFFGGYDASFSMNTNGAATFSIYTALCALVILQILYEKYEFIGLFIVLLFVRTIRLALWHRARGAFSILTFFFILYYVISKRYVISEKLFRIVTILATFGSLLFVFLYTVIGRLGVNFYLPIFYKNIFSGREDIWYEFFTYFCKKPITGIGTNLTIESFFEFNVHNAMYDILVVHGAVVFLITMFIVHKKFASFREKAINNKTAFLALCVLLSVFFESYIDMDLIWADYSMNLIYLLIVINANYDDSKIAESAE